jgi:hypothetical protein
MAVQAANGDALLGNLTIIPSAQKWLFHAIYKWKNCPITVTLLFCKLMDYHQTCSPPITSPKQNKVI